MNTIEDCLSVHYSQTCVYYFGAKVRILLAQQLEEIFADALTLPSAGMEQALAEIFRETLREVQKHV